MEEKISIDRIFDYRVELLDRYYSVMGYCNKKKAKSDIERYIRYRVDFMPYWMLDELDRLNFDIDIKIIKL